MFKTVKTTFISTLALVAAVAMFVYIVPQVTSKTKDEQSNVQVIITFTPTPRTGKPIRAGGQLTDVVTIVVSVGRGIDVAHVTPTKAKVSPWDGLYYLTPGSRIVASAEQFTGADLGCQILYLGQVQATKNSSGPTGVTCAFTAPK